MNWIKLRLTIIVYKNLHDFRQPPYNDLVLDAFRPYDLLIFRRRDCRAVHWTTSFRCNCRCICTPHACKSHTFCPSVSDKDRKASCIYGSNRRLVCTRISFEFFLPAVKGWQRHLGTALGNSRSWGNYAHPVRNKNDIDITFYGL